MKLKKKNSRMLLGAVLVAIAAVTVLGALVVTKGAGFGDFRSRASNPLEAQAAKIKAEVDAAVLTPLYALTDGTRHYYTTSTEEKDAKIADGWTLIVEDGFMVPSEAGQYLKGIHRYVKGNDLMLSESNSLLVNSLKYTDDGAIFYAASQSNINQNTGLQPVWCMNGKPTGDHKGDKIYVLSNRKSYYSSDYDLCAKVDLKDLRTKTYTTNGGTKSCMRNGQLVPCTDGTPTYPPAFGVPIRQTND